MKICLTDIISHQADANENHKDFHFYIHWNNFNLKD